MKYKLLFVIMFFVLVLVACKPGSPTPPVLTKTPEGTAYPAPVTPVYKTEIYPAPAETKGVIELTPAPTFSRRTPTPVLSRREYFPSIFGENAPYPMDRFITLREDGTPYLSAWGMKNQCLNKPFECIGIPVFQERVFYPPSVDYNIRFVVVHSEYWGVGNVYFLYPWEGCIRAEGGNVCVSSNGSLFDGTATEVVVASQEGSPLIMLVDICYGKVEQWDYSPCNANWADPTPTPRVSPTPRITSTPSATANVQNPTIEP